MTQPAQAVGGEALAPDSSPPAATDPIDAIVKSFLDEDEDERQPEIGEEDEAYAEPVEDYIEDEADELPPIAPPVSWTAGKKEEFARLPRDLQEYVSTRETERERFVQSKAQEAAQVRSEVEKEALACIQQLQSQAAEQLAQYASLMEVPLPDPQLLVDGNLDGYAKQLARHQHFTAQREQAQRQAEQARQQAAFAQQEIHQREQAEIQAVLEKEFPEYLDPVEGPKLRQQLGSIALELGYSAEQLANVDAKDILAMRNVANLKAKADKYDALMAKKMENVRAHKGKNLPPVARPGTAQPRGQASEQAKNAAWERAKQTRNPDAYADWLTKAGII